MFSNGNFETSYAYFGISKIGNEYTLLYTVVRKGTDPSTRFKNPFSIKRDVEVIYPEDFSLQFIIPEKVNSKIASKVRLDILDVTSESYCFTETQLSRIIDNLNEGSLGTNDLEKRIKSSLGNNFNYTFSV